MSKEDDKKRYDAAAHKVQAGLAFLMHIDPELAMVSIKQMRVGIDMGKSDQLGLARLLIDKGLFTEEEYYTAMANAAEIEAEDMQELVARKLGRGVTLI